MAVMHQPKTLAVLISLIGTAASPAALAYTEVEVPAATALDLTRWSPGLAWRDDEQGAGRTAPAADDFGTPEPVLVALPARKPEPLPEAAPPEPRIDAQAAAADPGIAEVHPNPEVRPHVIRRLIERFSAKLMPAAALDAVPIVRDSGLAPAAMAPVADVASVHAEWLMKDLADILPSDVQGAARQQLLAQVAKRFPAAVEAPAPAEAPRARGVLQSDGFTPRIERQQVVVASHTSKVMRNLGSILSEGVAPLEEKVVNTQAEKVLVTMMALSADRKVHQVEAKRQARRAARALEAEAAAAPPPLDIELPLSDRLAAEQIDIRLDELPAMAEHPSPLGSRMAVVNDTSLDRVRGGFVTNGLNVSFGIERAAYVNGVLVATTSLNVSDLGRITGGSGTAAFDSGKLALIQSGAGNLVSVGSISPTSVGTVVQNAIDGQKIQNVTVINATVNSLGVLRGLDLQSSLRGAVVDSLRR